MNPGLTLPKEHTATPTDPLPWCIHELFDRQAHKTPDAIAVCCGAEQLTYRQLNEQANQLAHYLHRLGVKNEVPVALYLERSVKMVVAILGVLKAGGAYVPIDLAYPKERLAFMLEDTQAPVLLTQSSLQARLPERTPRQLCLDTDWPQVTPEATEDPINPVTSRNLAYIIYTSGSTGKPKGVLVTHHNVVRLLKQTEHWYGFSSGDVWPLFHSYAFDVSVWELWGCLFYGGRLVVVPYLVTRSPFEFYELLAREKVTVLNQTPSAFRQLIWAEANAPVKQPLYLRYVICAGEALELQSLKPWFDRHGDERPRIINKYGITETTVHSTYRVIRQSDLASGVGSVIGVPIPDLQLYLVDEDLKPVPPGTPGEICVGGAGVARGYLNRPDLTRRRFLSDPFSDVAGARMYRSGDLAQINAHGEMEYLGRLDHQVKIRGFRVELGEIESALNRHPEIRESVVIAQSTRAGDKRLVAYVVPVQASPTVTELRAHLAERVPDYMLPAVFITLPALPLTTNGKVDRRALPNPEGARPELEADFVAPSTPAEQSLAAIWCRVLELEKVGAHDNFFELGGDSIRSIRILAEAQQAGFQLALQDIFQTPTVAGLAARARAVAGTAPRERTEPFGLISAEDRAKLPPDIEDAYPLACLQLGMFFFNELDPLSAMYHDVFSYRLQARFDRELLQTALNRLAQRHPLLRTSFQLAGYSRPLQLVHRSVRVPFSVEDLSQLAAPEQQARVADWIETEKRRPFDRAVPPLFRFHVQVRSSEDFQFFISFHHSCLDGWSLAVVVTEVFEEYARRLKGEEVELPALQPAYRDFVALEQRDFTSEASRRFWTEKLRGATPQLLPRWPDRLRAGGHEQQRGPEVQIDEPTLAGLKVVAQTAGVPLKTVLLAAHQRVMAVLYGQSDVVTGLIANGRPETLDGDKLVGLFLNTLPLRTQIEPGTWRELVRQTFAAEQELVPHRRVPLAEIQKLVGGQVLFETAFDFVHFHVYKNLQHYNQIDLEEGHYFEANNLATYTTFMLDVTSTRLELHIDYHPKVICREQIEEVTQYYVRILQAMAAQPDACHETFSPLSEAERNRLLVTWNATQTEFPRDQTISGLFEERARENPEAVALAFGERRLTYRQLDEQANRIANALRARGLARQELVGICLERSPEMVIGLLGILKAGGAYVPLDPTYPKERLAFMLADANARRLLTQASLLTTLPESSAQVLLLEKLLAPESDMPDPGIADVPATGPRAEDLAYVIYTSGSTGQPKGVQVLHRAVVNLLLSAAQTARITARDNLLAVTTLSFDIAALELFLPLVLGGQLTLASREAAGDGTELGALIASSGATLMQATPATWRLLLEAGWRGNRGLKTFCGGEALSRELADELLARTGGVWNFYGPTETTIWSTAWRVAPGEPVLIGRPLANTQLYILDRHRQPVPVGTAGELHIGGEGLARGYLNRPELTAERFIPHPAAVDSQSRLYKTGDLARYLPDGRVECLGRLDHQVKIRGFRIELGEVESALREHAGIADALVTARNDALGERRLIGYIISRNGPPDPVELKDFLRRKLPLYMVPAQFVRMDRFPLTPNGKIDRRQLPAPETVLEPARNYIAPRNSDEQTLAAIWQEVLQLPRVGIDDNFFDLGGNSLSATRAFARINRTFSARLTLREILERPAIRSLAELVAKTKGSAAARPAIRRQPRLNRST